jgi:uncharacterized protein
MIAPTQRILIAGGAGLIGAALTQKLVDAGNQVWILSRHPEAARAPSGAQLVAWDGRTTDGWLPLVDQADAVIHLAGANIGASVWTDARRKEIVSSRVESGKAVCAAIQSASRRPKVLIQASAIGYYGNSETAFFTEADPAGDGWLPGVCVAWEDATRPVEDLDVRRVVIRTGLVLDRHAGILPRMELPFRLWAGGRLGSGKQWMSWIHIQDEIEAVLFLLENETARGAYNLTAPTPLTNVVFEHCLGKALQRPDWIAAPGFAIRLALGKMSELILQGQRVLPERLSAAGYAFHFTDLPSALADIYQS